jgi:F-type H+-transporting ATPase subunit b
LFEIESGLTVWEILTFILLIVILRLYAWRPLLLALNKREAAIRQSIESAEEAKRDAEKVLEEARYALSQFDRERERIRLRGYAFSDQLKVTASTAAASEAERILDENRKEIQRVKEKAIQQLRAEVGGLVVDAAALIIDHAMDAARHRKLIESVLVSLPVDGIAKEESVQA